MRVVIAEKPSVARDIANVIGADIRKTEWFEGNGFYVTWLFGHLLELDAPEAKGPWKVENLPLLPEKFVLKPIPMETKSGHRPRLDVIKELFDRSSGIVVATDAGREGELIFRNLYSYLGCRKPFERLWISSLTEKSIRDGFANLRDGHDYDRLAEAAEQRNLADWRVGINATRAMTLACGCRSGFILSLGRVQTPTLCMICRRYIEHENFKPEPYWYIDGSSVKDGLTFRWRGVDRYSVENGGREKGEADLRGIQALGYITVEEVKTESVTEAPPILYDIDALQKAANSKYGYTLDQSLAIAQSLYEKKITTYPRTSSRYIPDDVFETVPELLKSVTGDKEYGQVASALLSGGKLNRRSVNNDKITDHHAIIITGNKPDGLTEEERNVYELVLVRFLEAFSPVCVADKTNVIFDGGGVKFSANGRRDVSLGWRAVSRNGNFEEVELSDVDEVEMSMRPLPQMKEGDRIDIANVELIEDATKPKPLLTDATLLTEMENAGRKSDDKQVTEALREIGIGTAATRAETLKTLIARNYVTRSKKKLSPTPLGLEMFVAVKDMAIANVALTARWEIALGEIEDGTRESAQFEQKICEYTRRLTAEILKSGSLERLRRKVSAALDKEIVKCPKCGHEMRFGEKSAWCNTEKGGCGFTVWRNVAGKKLSDDTLRSLITKGGTGMVSGFVGKSGNRFDARLKLETDGKVVFEFDKKK